MSAKRKLIAVAGPTASGKSQLGIHLAKEFGGEIINCDSLQMYRWFDIGTGKLRPEEWKNIPHHLLDVLDPRERFDAGEFARQAQDLIASIESRNNLPIVVGGTGFYLRALIDGLFPGPGRNPQLRERLQQRGDEKSRSYLHRILKRLDPSSAARIHANDTPKIIRAIEVCMEARRPMSEMFHQGRQALQGYRVLKIGLLPDREALREAISRRTQTMFDHGLVEEVRAILSRDIPRTAPPFQSVGYREALQLIDGSISRDQAIVLTQIRTRQYAKRQITWFRKEANLYWLDGLGNDIAIQRRARELVTSELLSQAL